MSTDPRFAAAGRYIEHLFLEDSSAHRRLFAIAEGSTEKIELSGGAFALEQVYQPRARPEGFFESHRKYIDFQVIVAGEELMEVQELSRLVVAEPYNPERDFVKYADSPDASLLHLRAGDVAIFFPEDGHMPALRWRSPGLVRKAVVKVPVK